jgi:phospholipid-binding lipoprotein MlaA
MKYAANPTTWLYLPIQISIPLYVVNIVDLRSRFDSVVRFRNAASIDPYLFTRNAYLQFREAQIHEGQSATGQSFYDEDSDASPAATRPASGHGE